MNQNNTINSSNLYVIYEYYMNICTIRISKDKMIQHVDHWNLATILICEALRLESLFIHKEFFKDTSNFSNDTAESLTPSHHFDFLVHHLKHVPQDHFSPSKGNPSWTMKRLVVSDNWWQPPNPETPGFTKGWFVQNIKKKQPTHVTSQLLL